MTVSSQICKRIYQADGQNRQWAVDFAYLSAAELKVYVTDVSGVQTDVTAHCMWDEVEREMIYPTVASEQDPLPVGSTVTIVRVTTPTQTLHLTQQGTLDAAALEGGFDKLTLHVQELAEQAQRAIKYPVSSNKTDADAQTFLTELQSTQTAALNSALESVAATKTQLQQAISDEQTARQQADAGLQSAIATKQNTLSTEGQQAVSSGISAAKVASYDVHLLSTTNPHNVTKTQVGLGNVDNTADLDKPISTAVQTALNGKQASLTSAQLAAVNSGATAVTVAQIQTNKENIAAIDAELEENREWQKPFDWIDIRSGAMPNSIYFLVGHSAPVESDGIYTVATYPIFRTVASVSNSGTYDVYVDGVKLATTESATATELDWGALYTTGTIIGGFDVTYPSNLTTHVVRVTPSVASNTLSSIAAGAGSNPYGLLWGHFSLSNAIDVSGLATWSGEGKRAPLLEAYTATNDELKVQGSLAQFGREAYGLKKLPTLNFNGAAINLWQFCPGVSTLKCLKIKNGRVSDSLKFNELFGLKKIETEDVVLPARNYDFNNVRSLIKLPAGIDFSSSTNLYPFLTNAAKLEDTVLDVSGANNATRLGVYGSTTYPMRGLKGLTVSPQAPFNSTTSPQINVSYTGLDRVALVNLFNSMPYNVGYTVVGSPTIVDGIASGFSTDNYLRLNQSIVFNNTTFEIGTKATTGSNINTTSYLFTLKAGDTNATRYCLGISLEAGNFKTIGTLNGTSWVDSNWQDKKIIEAQTNTTYWFKWVATSTEWKIYYSLDGQNYTLSNTYTLPDVLNYTANACEIGRFIASSGAWLGSIDLNNTYIKFNGVPWFTGQAAMTKTCSVVGCTGTADLTAEDKAIATGKGWELVTE